MESPEVDGLAPALEVVDPEDGSTRDIGQLATSDRTLLYWIKADCPTCRMALPFVERLAQRVEAGRVAVIVQDGPDRIADLRQDVGLSDGPGALPMYCEPEPFESADAWGLTQVPTWFVVDATGHITRSGSMFSQPDLDWSLHELGGSGALFSSQERAELPEARPG